MGDRTDDPPTSRPTPGKGQSGQQPRALDEEGAVGKQFTGMQGFPLAQDIPLPRTLTRGGS